MQAGSRTLFGWCAWDTLFLPELLGEPVRVRSVSPDGTEVTLGVEAGGVRERSHPAMVVTLPRPEQCRVEDVQVLSTFCRFIHFFTDPEAARSWAREALEDALVLPLVEAFRLGAECNRLRFGAVLGSER